MIITKVNSTYDERVTMCFLSRINAVFVCFVLWTYIISSSSSSSSSCHAISMDISDPLWPHLPIVHASGKSSRLHPVSAQSCCM